MAKNDIILLDAIIEEQKDTLCPSEDIGKFFEYFCSSELLKNYDLEPKEIRDGITDGKDDGGIDSFYIFVNGHLLNDTSTFVFPNSNTAIDVYIITSKHGDTFKQEVLNSEISTITEFFDLSLTNDELKGDSEIEDERLVMIKIITASSPQVRDFIIQSTTAQLKKMTFEEIDNIDYENIIKFLISKQAVNHPKRNWRSNDFLLKLLDECAINYSIKNFESFLKTYSPKKKEKVLKHEANNVTLDISNETLELVKNSAPKQPWNKGMSYELSKQLNIDYPIVKEAISILINKGVFKQQINGILYNKDGSIFTP